MFKILEKIKQHTLNSCDVPNQPCTWQEYIGVIKIGLIPLLNPKDKCWYCCFSLCCSITPTWRRSLFTFTSLFQSYLPYDMTHVVGHYYYTQIFFYIVKNDRAKHRSPRQERKFYYPDVHETPSPTSPSISTSVSGSPSVVSWVSKVLRLLVVHGLPLITAVDVVIVFWLGEDIACW